MTRRHYGRSSVSNEPLRWPPSASPALLHPASRAYVKERGLLDDEVESNGLHYVETGEWTNRLLIPIFEGEALVAFQGRSLDGTEPRYRTAGPRPIYVPWGPIEYAETVLDRVLCLVEGPFDAFATARVCLSAATLGNMPSPRQIKEILALCSDGRIDQIVVWYDAEAVKEAFDLQLKLRPYIETVVHLDPTVKDPGGLLPCNPDCIGTMLARTRSGNNALIRSNESIGTRP